jgi:hypothetical protein
MGGSPRDYFLDNLSSWDFDIPYSTQWIVRITPVAGVGGFLSNIGSTIGIDHSRFELDPRVLNTLFGEQVQSSSDGIGLYFAQTITTPEESFAIDTGSALDGSGGFLQGIVGGNRSAGAARSINIDFLETNLDFVDGIIRPWIITASYNGLIELDRSQSIKADIEVVQYTKGVGRPVRKIHSFINCVPYSVQSNSLDYEAEKVIKRTVGWIYNHYTYRLLQGEETGIPFGKTVPSVMGGIGAAMGSIIPKGIPVENIPKAIPVENIPKVIPLAPPRVVPVTEQDRPITPW